MLELDESDAKQVAIGRYFKATRSTLIKVFTGAFALFCLLLFLSIRVGAPIWLIFFPLAGIFAYLVHWERNKRRSIIAFIEEWKERE